MIDHSPLTIYNLHKHGNNIRFGNMFNQLKLEDEEQEGHNEEGEHNEEEEHDEEPQGLQEPGF